MEQTVLNPTEHIRSFVGFCEGYPDFKQDLKVFETDMATLDQKQVLELLQMNEDMPGPCRTDVCPEELIETERKGDFLWPGVLVGQTAELRCPFSFQTPLYLARNCSVNSTQGQAIWGEAGYDLCPEPPLAHLLNEADNEIEKSDHLDEGTEYFAELLKQIENVFEIYRGTPMDNHDISRLLMKMTNITTFLLLQNDLIPPEVGLPFTRIINTLMESDLENIFHLALETLGYYYILAEQLGQVALELGSNDFRLNNVALYKVIINASGTQKLNVTQDLDMLITTEDTVMMLTSIVEIKKPYVFTPHSLWEWIKPICQLEKDECFAGSLIFFAPERKFSDFSINIEVHYEFEEEHFEPRCLQYWSKSKVTDRHCQCTSANNYQYPLEVLCKYVGFGLFTVVSESITVNLQNVNLISTWKDRRHFCLITPLDDQWTVEQETGIFTYYSILVPDPTDGVSIPDDGGPAMSFDVLLGFPYMKELDLVATVFGITSLVCLVVTVASFSIFRNTHKGSPTTILLNLCVALIVLLALLLAIQYSGQLIGETGCTVCNVLRYYIIFVTLMWNAVEAFNMYLLLVKVFNSDFKSFGLKAGVIAWGIPLIMVCVCFLVNKKSFNGEHVIVSESKGQCAFKCHLQSGMLYYGFLLPMAVLMMHNLIIFGFVVKVIFKHGRRMEDGRNPHIVKLVGAVATLVLLGLPWMFSTFGVVDGSNNAQLSVLEGVFQVIFVVLVNLQGVFIFAFHCVRNAQIRKSWTSVFTSISGTESSHVTSHVTNHEDRCLTSSTQKQDSEPVTS